MRIQASFRFLTLGLLVSTLAVCAVGLHTTANFAARPRQPSKFIRIEDGGMIDEANVRTARETLSHSTETPTWTNAAGFGSDVFTFARVIFQSDMTAHGPGRFGPRLGWWVDYPDADLNLSWRLQELTSIRTDPDCRVLKLTDADLHDYPLLYMEHAGYMLLTDEEVLRLRAYLASGGALFVNDFWSSREWTGFADQIDRVFPGRAWVDLTTDHPLFYCVFDLRGPMHLLRVPTIQFWNGAFDPRDPRSLPHRVFRGEGSESMTVRVLCDESQRIMIVAIHNSDVSDGWERESESDLYFDRFSEKIAYPLGINIITYLMMH